MKVLTKKQLDDYQQNKSCFDIFHTYHPINENEQLIYKKTNPSNIIKQAEQVTHPKTTATVSSKPKEQTTTHSNVVATDRRPQNPQFQNRGHQNTSMPNDLGPNITDDTYNETQETKTTTPVISVSNNVAPTHTQQTVTESVNEIRGRRRRGNHFEAQATPTESRKSAEPEVTRFTPQNAPQAESTKPQERTTNTQQNVRHANQFAPRTQIQPSTLSQNKAPDQYQQSQTRSTNMISQTVKNTNKIANEKDLNAELYEEIRKSATQLAWIQQVNSFELGYKKDLRNLPIPALRTFDLADDEEMYLPLNEATTLHDINSFTITKDMCILLLFRNNAAISLAPEKWFENGKNRKLLIENGFEYYYKAVDANLLTETLKKISSTSASTADMTQFIIKHMPFTPVER